MDVGRAEELLLNLHLELASLVGGHAGDELEPALGDLVSRQLEEARRASVGASSPDDAEPVHDVEAAAVGADVLPQPGRADPHLEGRSHASPRPQRPYAGLRA